MHKLHQRTVPMAALAIALATTASASATILTLEDGNSTVTINTAINVADVAIDAGTSVNTLAIDSGDDLGIIAGTDVKKRQYGPTLVRTGEKARFDHLSRWIHDPKALHSQTRMPNMRLGEDQSEAIAAWLVTQREEDVPPEAWSQVPDYLNDREKAKEGYETIPGRVGSAGGHQGR